MTPATVDDFTADSNGTPATIEEAPVESRAEPVVEQPVETPAAEVEDTTDAAAPPEQPDLPDLTEPRSRDEQGRFNKPSSLQKRINEATAKQRAAERVAEERAREAQYWRQQAELRQTPSRSETAPAGTHPQTSGDAEPVFEQFANESDPYLAFVDARTEWRVRQALKQEREQTQQQQQTQFNQARVAKFYADIESMRATTPDFDSAVAVLKETPVSPEVSQAVLDAENPALVALHLARHAEEYDHIRSLTGHALHRALGRLESRLSAAPSGPAGQAAVTKANPPIKPVGSSPIVNDSPPTDSDSDDAHFEYWNRKEREGRRR